MLDYIKVYDSFPYPSLAHHLSHPSHLETIAKLVNIPVANSESARILEIGAGTGGNAIPMAEQLPDSQVVAVDLSAVQVAQGNRIISRLGLRNIDFHQADLRALDDSYREFDYVICHGIFSWVPEEVAARLLEVVRQRLAPQGVAYLSYNTYPAWHMRQMLRRMLLDHTRSIGDPLERVLAARQYLSFLAESVVDKASAYGRFLLAENERIAKASDAAVIHDILAEHNNPVYFHEFFELAKQHDLCYLADSQLKSMWLNDASLGTLSNPPSLTHSILDREQTNDFLHNRGFRQSLLCHQGITIDRTIYASVLRDMFVTSALRALPPDGASGQQAGPRITKFADATGVYRLSSQDELVVETLQRLSAAYPGSLPFKALVQSALPQTKAEPVTRERFLQIEKSLAQYLTQLYSTGLIELSVKPDRFTTQVSAKPRVSPLAALQVAGGQSYATNRRHHMISIEPLAGQLMQLADGSRNRNQLAQALSQTAIYSGLMGESHLTSSTAIDENPSLQLHAATDRALQSLARNCLLID